MIYYVLYRLLYRVFYHVFYHVLGSVIPLLFFLSLEAEWNAHCIIP